jgi:putative tryptophan/tyrosine transport system substrate-binding protein
MRRREFIAALGGAAAWPFVGHAQRVRPVIGYLNGASAKEFPHLLAGFRRGLTETGYEEGRNVTIEYRYADGQYDQLPALTADLISRKVSVLVATAGTPTIRAAKAATSKTPIVFVVGGDPVAFGIVASLSRPGSNITGITLVSSETVAKRLGLLLELIPADAVIAVLANPNNPVSEPQVRELQTAARSLDRELFLLTASTESELATAFAAVEQKRMGGLIVAADPFFDDRRAQVVSLAAKYKVPACYVRNDFVKEGGLLSYGPDATDAFRQAGVYTGRILKGEKPSDLPVMQPTKFTLSINLSTAKSLGLTLPPTLIARADEVIE